MIFTSAQAAAEMRRPSCVACGGVKRPYWPLCSACLARLPRSMRLEVEAASGEAMTRAVAYVRGEIARERAVEVDAVGGAA